jgi:hypothetical protein
MKKILAIVSLFAFNSAAFATEIDTLAKMQEVCMKKDKITLSKKAQLACENGEKNIPKLNKKGDKFTAAKTGAEFNALIANLANFK